MIDELTLDEIKIRLMALPDCWLSAAFAARMATHGLPELAVGVDSGKPFLGFWDEEKCQKYLLNVLRAWQCAWCVARFKNAEMIDDAAFAAADAAADASFAVDAAGASFAVNAAISVDVPRVDRAARAVIAAAVAAATRAAADRADADRAAADRAADRAAFFADTAITAANADTAKKYMQILEKNQDIISFLQQPFGDDFLSKSALFLKTLREWKAYGFDYWADWYEARLRGEPLNEEMALASCFLSAEILAGTPAEINSYLKSLQDNSANIPLNRVRVIFIGYGNSGKTSLIRALHGKTVEEGKEEMTPGIDIHEWPVPEAEDSPKPDASEHGLTALLWDFGGQVMAHATHQFFLRSRCLYVLVMEGRAEIGANEQAEYWLEHVRAFGDNAPVMIVGNKADQKVPLNLDTGYLGEKYKNIVNFYSLSCTDYKSKFKSHFDEFRRDFIKQLRSLAEKEQIRFTQSHFAVWNDLKKASAKKTFLPEEDYKKICENHGIQKTGEMNQDWFLTLLDRLGEVIHFPQLEFLNDYLLNPRWLTYGVYHLLYSKKAQDQKGELTDQMVTEILRDGEFRDNLGNALRYTRQQCRFIKDALEEFEIGFRMEKHRILIPALMPSDTPKHDFEKNNALAFDFDFSGFLPRHLISGFIVQCHYDIDRNIVWQRGVLLCSQDMDASALVQADYHERKLSLWVQGSQASRYFSILHEKIIVILKRMTGLQYKEWVHLLSGAQLPSGTQPPGGAQPRRAGYRQLLAMERAGEERYISEDDTIFSLAKVLKIMPVEKRRAETININKAENVSIGGQMGDYNHIHDIHNSSINIKSPLDNVQQTVQPSEKAKLEELIAQLQAALENAPKEKAEYVEVIEEGTERLIKEIERPKPNRTNLQITGEGLIKAADALTTVAPKTLDLVNRIVKMVTGLGF